MELEYLRNDCKVFGVNTFTPLGKCLSIIASFYRTVETLFMRLKIATWKCWKVVEKYERADEMKLATPEELASEIISFTRTEFQDIQTIFKSHNY